MITLIGISILGAIIVYTLTMIFYGTVIFFKLKQENEYEEPIPSLKPREIENDYL